VSDVLHRMTEIDPPFKNSAHRAAIYVIERPRAIENHFFDRVVLDGGGFQAGRPN
jgi:hypothetical protein